MTAWALVALPLMPTPDHLPQPYSPASYITVVLAAWKWPTLLVKSNPPEPLSLFWPNLSMIPAPPVVIARAIQVVLAVIKTEFACGMVRTDELAGLVWLPPGAEPRGFCVSPSQKAARAMLAPRAIQRTIQTDVLTIFMVLRLLLIGSTFRRYFSGIAHMIHRLETSAV